MSSLGADRPVLQLGRVLKGLYRLERVLGVGGMGAVFEAVDPAGQRFAVKVVHPAIVEAQGAIERFLREARVGSEISSPHVVAVVDSGREDDGTIFLVMPMLSGFDAAGLLERTGPLDPSAAVRIALQTCAGLAAAHRLGVVHRDLKPSNLFLHHRTGGEVIVRVCDFGVAKRTDMYDDSSLTRTGTSMGSPLYMSPEQVLSAKHVDPRADVWGLGATLYELLTGISPHGEAETVSELMVRICTRNAPSIQDRAPWIAPELAIAVHHTLQRDRERRTASIEELAAELAALFGSDTSLTSDALHAVAAERRAIPAARADLAALTESDGPIPSMPGLPVAAPEGDPLLGKTLDGKYRVVRVLGRGGMGAVYEAAARDQERVAVKVIACESAEVGQEASRRFAREAKAAMSIANPHVVTTFDAGTDAATGHRYLAMELLHGLDVSAVIKRVGPLRPDVLARVAIQAARGIAAVHAEGIVHRDVKPANIFLSVKPGEPWVTVKICDFGIAKRTNIDGFSETQSHDLTRTGGMLGSPAYMSPEQAQNARNVDLRTDVWSLGTSLYEALSGRHPWEERTSLGQLIVAICTGEVPPLPSVAPWVEPGFAEIVHRMLDRDPACRFESMDQLIAALVPYTSGTEAIRRDELQGMDAGTRARVVLRSMAPAQSRQTADAFSLSHRPASPTSRWIAIGLVAIVTFVVVGIGVGAGLRTLVGPGREATNNASMLAPTTAAIATVVVDPADATVTVNGREARLEQGTLRLAGAPGDTFNVEVRKEGRERRATVVITRGGTASPNRILLAETPPSPSRFPAVEVAPAKGGQIGGSPGRESPRAGADRPASPATEPETGPPGSPSVASAGARSARPTGSAPASDRATAGPTAPGSGQGPTLVTDDWN